MPLLSTHVTSKLISIELLVEVLEDLVVMFRFECDNLYRNDLIIKSEFSHVSKPRKVRRNDNCLANWSKVN